MGELTVNLKEFVKKNNLVAFDVTSYASCSCCCIGHYPTQIATLNENGVPVPISKELYDEACRIVGTKLQHGQVNSLVKNGVLKWVGQWEQDHMDSAWDFSNITLRFAPKEV
jgi:hypothetical protein